MGLLDPAPLPYDPLEWEKLPLNERARLACLAWAEQGYGTPLLIYVVYALKVAAYVGGWLFFCTRDPSLGLANIGDWALSPLAFLKAILWSMLFEGLGFGCGSGPLTGRYVPPVGGFLYFLRPGTTKLPLWPKLPVLGGARRTLLDVALYAGLCFALVRALLSPHVDATAVVAIAVLVPVLGIADKTVFLALRAEHYWLTVLCFVFARDWIGGAKAVQLALWFWAGVSKLNHHFPAVVCVMTSNGPFTRYGPLRRWVYRDYPKDLRPSKVAGGMAHAGTALELGVPIILLCSTGGTSLVVGLTLMLALHLYITSNVPMGVPIEWNVMVVYGAFALFWEHPEARAWNVAHPPLAVALVVGLLVLPLVGNLAPRAVSFLLAMRYYAGNWAYSVWLFRGESHKKLERLTKSSAWVYDQLERLYDHPTAVGLGSKVMAFRMMHLHGRALPELLPRAVPHLPDYTYVDGEIVAGLVLGWNFGDGHLHDERLLAAVQSQCHFEPGELRCILVESQSLGGKALPYRIVDAASGELERGQLALDDLRARQPWQGADEASRGNATGDR